MPKCDGPESVDEKWDILLPGLASEPPAIAVEVAKLLLDAGAKVDALANVYENKFTIKSMLVSSCHPTEAVCKPRLRKRWSIMERHSTDSARIAAGPA